MTGGGEFARHVIDREIALPHGHRQITDAIAGGRGLGSALWADGRKKRVFEDRGGTDNTGRGTRLGNNRSGGRRRVEGPPRRGKRGGVRTGAAWGTGGTGRSSDWQVSLSDSQ